MELTTISICTQTIHDEILRVLRSHLSATEKRHIVKNLCDVTTTLIGLYVGLERYRANQKDHE